MSGILYKLNRKSRPKDLEVAFSPLSSSLSTVDCRLPTNSPYTLLEILMVISIMALLMAITMPAFNDMMKGQGVESAARNICQRLKLARSYAISNREYVAVLFPQSAKNGTAYPSSGIPTKYYDHSYRACLVTKNGTHYDFKRWIPGENWSFLPTGTAIFETDNDKGTVLAGSPPIPSNGTCTLIKQVDFSDLDGGGSSIDDVSAILFKPTGRSGGLRYIDIGEGAVNGSTLVVTNPDVAAVVTVTVDQYTGRVSYGDD